MGFVEGFSPHNLPEQPHSLLGRDREMEAARALLLSEDARLLTLTGAPGVGKTRLAMELARMVLDAFPDGVWFVDLAPVQEPDLVGSKIAGTFGLAVVHEEGTLNNLITYLEGRRLLLFLDNFEQVLPAAAWVSTLLERTTTVTVLTTSREPLRLRWERVMPLLPLPVPDLEGRPEFFTLLGTACIELFVQRAIAVNPEFVLSPENAPAVTTLCARLDGLPLAIELAAARASVLSAEEILAYMDDRFRLLETGVQDLPERQQTLEAAIDWSYELLAPEERHFLRRLSVFSGGFTARAAEIVGGSPALLGSLGSLIGLVEKSLLNTVRGPSGETRFLLLESIRAYLLDRLRTSGDLDDTRRRHIAYYLEFAEQKLSKMERANMKASYDLLEVEHDNLRAALQSSLHLGEYALGKRIAATIWYFWGWRGHMQEGVRWLETFLASDAETIDETHLQVLEGAGTLRAWQGDYEQARTLLREALQLAEKRDDSGAIIRILAWLGWIFGMSGETEEAIWLAERIDACSRDLDPWDLSYAYFSLGSLLYEANRDEAAEKEFARSIEISQFDRENYTAIHAEFRLALLLHKKGQTQEAKEVMMRALNAARQSNARPLITSCTDAAVLLLIQSADQQLSSRGTSLEMLAQLLGTVDYWREILSSPRSRRDSSTYSQMAEILKRRMGEQAFLRAWTEGQSIPIESAVAAAIELMTLSGQTEPRQERSANALSEREGQVLALVAEGLTAREIGERLFITERTVRYHITSIFNKLGANNRAQAVALAGERGLL